MTFGWLGRAFLLGGAVTGAAALLGLAVWTAVQRWARNPSPGST